MRTFMFDVELFCHHQNESKTFFYHSFLFFLVVKQSGTCKCTQKTGKTILNSNYMKKPDKVVMCFCSTAINVRNLMEDVGIFGHSDSQSSSLLLVLFFNGANNSSFQTS